MTKYAVAHIDELDRIEVAGVNWRPVRRRFDIRAFGVNAYTADAGEHVVEEHDESRLRHEELYVVLTGRARFTIGAGSSDSRDAQAACDGLVNLALKAGGRDNVTAVLARAREPGKPGWN